MKTDNRRNFLKKSILGVSGAALVPGIMKTGVSGTVSRSLPPGLPSRVLGRTGINTPLLSLGAAEVTTPALVKASYEAGIKLFFSATYYGEGNNEKLVGDALKGLPRDSFIVGTAVPPDGMDNRTGTFPNGFDADKFIIKAEGSLKRFGLDYVDILLFPFAGKKAVVQNDDVLKAMSQLKKQGKTRFTGIASHSDIEEALIAAADTGVYDIAMPAYNFKTQNKESMNAALAYAVKAGMGIVAMKTTAGAAEAKTGPAININAALKWVLQNENITSIVSGISSFEELQKNLAMIQNLKLTEQELKDLNLAMLPEDTGLWCHQCKTCLAQCPYNLDIPTMMRGYMYAYGYKNIKHAWNTISDVEFSGQCSNCTECSVKCQAGFDVKKKISDITRLRDVPADLIFTA